MHAEAVGQGTAPGSILVTRVAFREFHVAATGLWTPDYADVHFGQLKATLAGARGTVGARVLVDMTGADVQPVATADRIKHWTATIYGAQDRVAIVVSASALAKMQVRRVTMIAAHELFASRTEALEWLRAE